MQADIATMKLTNQMAVDKLMEIRDISLSGIDYLSKIVKNTNELYAMHDELRRIRENTNGL